MKEFLKVLIYKPLYNLLIFFAWLVPGHSIGWAIVFLTVLIRVILLPSSIKAARSQVKLQALQPKINQLRKDIPDQQAQSKAMMALYKEEGVSPFGACLPLLIQLPILAILYRVFTVGVNTLRTDLIYDFTPAPESINPFFFGLDLSRPEPWVLPILAGLAQFVLSKMMTPVMPKSTSGDAPDPMQMATKQMVYIFPIFTVVIARSLPAALGIYWIVTTLFGIAQQYYVNKSIKNNPKVVAEIKKEVAEENIDIKKIEEKAVGKDMMSKLMQKRLAKQEKKTGVQVSIRKKKG